MKSSLQEIPGIGPSLSRDLERLGILQVSDLIGCNPQELYDELIQLEGQHVDRCVLYVFRCAVYYASTIDPDPEKLKWWNWKDSASHA
jgi:nucleotidyltransferase/DNA polymerase involved in DNA repair